MAVLESSQTIPHSVCGKNYLPQNWYLVLKKFGDHCCKE